MIISRSPLRISLGGGGTDLPFYYRNYGGFLISGAIDKYIYLAVNKRFYKSIRLGYSKTEIIPKANKIKHPIFREAFKLLGIKDSIEAVSIADIPSGSGLGSSGAFTVCLLNALHTYKREFVPLQQLAEEACIIEMEKLKEPVGKQDQYASAFGGISAFTIEKDGSVEVQPVRIPNGSLAELENNILLFYLNQERPASAVLADQTKVAKKAKSNVISNMHRIKEMGKEVFKAFEKGKIDTFGELLDEHWQNKKKLSNKMTNPFIDECYEMAKQNGAIGGKVIGAGGGGFLMLYSKQNTSHLTRIMEKNGLVRERFRFDFEGAKIIANFRKS
ncbi:MAG: GHMP kinase [Desulfobacteraceae bacterium]|jgi:D-glycero-alpha-D-manno-heptose-7-phosphate kinase